MFFAPLLIGSLILGAIGTGVQVAGSIQAADAQKDLIRAQREGEAIRKSAMEIDANRRRRDVIRQGILSRSRALAVASNQGAGHGSGLQGAYGQIAGNTAFGVGGVNQQQLLGDQMFKSNQMAFNARMDQADAETTSSIGKGMSSLGQMVMSNMGPISNLSGGFGSGMNSMSSYGGQINAMGRGPIY